MATTNDNLATRAGMLCRTGAVALIAGVCRWRSIGEINERLKGRPVLEQALVTLAVFAILFALSLAAAQFGWVGVLLFWLAVILVVN